MFHIRLSFFSLLILFLTSHQHIPQCPALPCLPVALSSLPTVPLRGRASVTWTILTWPWLVHPKMASRLLSSTGWTRRPVCYSCTVGVPSGHWAGRRLARRFSCRLGPADSSRIFSHFSKDEGPCLSAFCSSLEPYFSSALVPLLLPAGISISCSRKGTG